MNQIKDTKFQGFSSSEVGLSSFRFSELQKEFDLNFEKDEQEVFALVFLGSFARNEAKANSDRDSILIFSNHVSYERQESIRKKCISILDLNQIPKCSGGMGIDSKNCSKTISEWSVYLSQFKNLNSVRSIVMLDAMRNQKLMVGNQTLLEFNQTLVRKAILSTPVTEILIAEGFYRIFFKGRNKLNFFLRQIVKYNYIFNEQFIINHTFARGLSFLSERQIISDRMLVWVNDIYLRHFSGGLERLTLLDTLKLRFIIFRILVKALLVRVLG